jgi:uncharacterized protein YjbI with pentapeptide repeats
VSHPRTVLHGARLIAPSARTFYVLSMARRADVTGVIQLDRADSLLIRDSACAEIFLRRGSINGLLHLTNVSVTERVDFAEASVNGSVTLEGLEDLGPFYLNGSSVNGNLDIRDCRFWEVALIDDASVNGNVRLQDAVFNGSMTFASTDIVGSFELTRTTFQKTANFRGGIYRGPVRLQQVTALELDFDGVSFHSSLELDAVRTEVLTLRRGSYIRQVRFNGLEILGRASLGFVTAEHTVEFADSTFLGEVDFTAGNYKDVVSFERVTFKGSVSFRQASFSSRLLFKGVTFEGPVIFQEGRFSSDVLFQDVVFNGPVLFAKALFESRLLMERVTFHSELQLGAAVSDLILRRVSLTSTSALVADEGRLFLDDTSFAAPVTLSGIPFDDTGQTTRVLSVEGTDLTHLVLADIDLSRCFLSLGHNLEKAKIETPSRAFAHSPNKWTFSHKVGRPWKWTSRRVVLEEIVWRSRAGRPSHREAWLSQMPSEAGTEPVSPLVAARVYRDLRKGLEEGKNEPGAADFYYGEMEMRRVAASGPERLLLNAYWLTSGYALRAWRALVSLAVLVGIATVTVAALGFAPTAIPPGQIVNTGSDSKLVIRWPSDHATILDSSPTPREPSFAQQFFPALTYSAESATAVFRGPDQRTPTLIGRWCQIALRIIGPVLLGLAVLSLRGRVKR